MEKNDNSQHSIKHVGIIMDGNGRWAESRGLDRSEGHRAGARTVINIIHAAIDAEIGALSLYAFSSENWRRPQDEVQHIMTTFDEYLEHEISAFLKRGVRFRVIGDRSKLSLKTRFLISQAERLSSSNQGMLLQMAISYGGMDELVRAVRKFGQSGGRAESIEAADIEQHLDSVGSSALDLVIRTSGEQRLSNFMIWQAAYAELYFTDTLWPDFSTEHFQQALDEYKRRQRRFGGVSA